MFRTTILEDRMPNAKAPSFRWNSMNPASTRPVSLSGQKSTPMGYMCGRNGSPDPRKGKLTNRQMTFAKLIVEGIYSNAECARRAGFTDNTAREYARKLLDGQHYPHVVEYITMREERQRRYGVTTIGSLKAKLSKGAAGQFSAAISGLRWGSDNRRETINTLDQLSRDEITARLAAAATEVSASVPD
jgi:DNA-binding CsgD family transcriptional regulator